MYKILKSTDQGLDELELEHLEKGYWLDIVAPSVEELQEIAAATKSRWIFECRTGRGRKIPYRSRG